MSIELEQAFAEIEAQTSFRQADVRALAQVTEIDDAMAILRGYESGNAEQDVAVFDWIMARLRTAADIAGVILPVLGLYGGLRDLIKG